MAPLVLVNLLHARCGLGLVCCGVVRWCGVVCCGVLCCGVVCCVLCCGAQVTYMTDKIPMKRCGTIAEVAATAAFIVSKEASFNTGFCFDLSGGRAVY